MILHTWRGKRFPVLKHVSDLIALYHTSNEFNEFRETIQRRSISLVCCLDSSLKKQMYGRKDVRISIRTEMDIEEFRFRSTQTEFHQNPNSE